MSTVHDVTRQRTDHLMDTANDVTRQRRDALAMLLQVDQLVETGPHHLYLDQIRTALEENISVLQERLGLPTVMPHGGLGL